MKVENRYLSLAGAPWSPNHPNSEVTLAQCFGLAATTLVMAGAIYINPRVEKMALFYMVESMAGVGLAAWASRPSRREEVAYLNPNGEPLVIDKAHDFTTPARSLCNVGHLCRVYRTAGLFQPDGLKGLLWSGVVADVFLNGVYAEHAIPSPIISSLGVGFMLTHIADVASRYWQLANIQNQKWRIIDQKHAELAFTSPGR